MIMQISWSARVFGRLFIAFQLLVASLVALYCSVDVATPMNFNVNALSTAIAVALQQATQSSPTAEVANHQDVTGNVAAGSGHHQSLGRRTRGIEAESSGSSYNERQMHGETGVEL